MQVGGRFWQKGTYFKINLGRVDFQKGRVDFGQGRVDFPADLENVVRQN